ncbi:MAG: aldehyde ferredoxin oxidoreductase family protein [Dehalococcoidia bacterium]|nr:aldehyde ferredoxin oxidoreductase family protein [Dehalococcoidia bacterium]
MYGWTGKFLRVDLTKSRITIEGTDEGIARDFIGARGMGVKYLYDEIDPKVDPLSPDNKLLMVTGPLTGTGAPAGNRYMVVTKSPLTGAIANSSAAGSFATTLKYAGYDMVIFEGKSKKPVYLWIDDDKVELRDAQHLWGKTTRETENAVIGETAPEAKVVCIGPAGERLVLFACIINDLERAAGRSGVGAVMGSKNLKAIAVRGTKGIKVANRVGFYNAMVDCYKALDIEYVRHFHELGTPSVLEDFVVPLGALPTRNYQAGAFEDWRKISGGVQGDTISVRKRMGVACPGCPVACGRLSKVTTPDFAGIGAGPEYETTGLFGSNCGVNNLDAIAKANYVCNEMGMDTISAGGTIACAMELYEKGYLPKKDIGRPLNFGDAHALVEMVEKIALREGFGDVLAQGAYRLAEKYGHPELFMGVKKQEFPSYECRALQGMAIGFATQSRGADHIRGEVHDIEMYGCYQWRITRDRKIDKVDPLTWRDKPVLAKEIQDWFCMIDSSGMCNFMFFFALDEDQCRALLETGTGIDLDGYKGFMKTGERIFNQERLFNLKAGLTGKDDTLPKRMLEEPMPDGSAKGMVAHLSEMLPEYYKLRGWGTDGVPTQEKLKELGLSSERSQ